MIEMGTEALRMKTCRKCGTQKSVSEFHAHKTGRDGYAAQCKTCRCDHQRIGAGLQRRQERTREFIDSGASKFYKRVQRLVKKGLPKDEAVSMAKQPIVKTSEQERIEKQYDALAERNARQAWIYFMREKASDEWMARYFECAGTPWLNPRIGYAEQYKLKYKLNNEYNLYERMRTRLRKKLKHTKIAEQLRSGLLRNKNYGSYVEQVVGYTIDDLRKHLERQFTRGMTWEKFKAAEIHIDHITPISAFDIKELGDEEWKRCWCLSNLRPLWAKENLKKRDKIVFLM